MARHSEEWVKLFNNLKSSMKSSVPEIHIKVEESQL